MGFVLFLDHTPRLCFVTWPENQWVSDSIFTRAVILHSHVGSFKWNSKYFCLLGTQNFLFPCENEKSVPQRYEIFILHTKVLCQSYRNGTCDGWVTWGRFSKFTGEKYLIARLTGSAVPVMWFRWLLKLLGGDFWWFFSRIGCILTYFQLYFNKRMSCYVFYSSDVYIHQITDWLHNYELTLLQRK